MAPKSLSDAGEVNTPEDVATLYSWANLHGAKYRDFSASRAQAREEARLRVEEALAEQRRKEAEEAERRAQEEAQIAAREAAEAAEAARQAEAERLAEIARQAEAERQAVLAAQEAQRQAVQQRAWQPALPEAYNGGLASPFDSPEASQDFVRFGDAPASSEYRQPAVEAPSYRQTFDEPTAPIPRAERVSEKIAAPPAAHANPPAQLPIPASKQPSAAAQGTMYTTPATKFQEYTQPQYAQESYREPFQAHYPAAAQEPYMPSPWHPADVRETREIASGPAWLATEMPVRPAAQAPIPPVAQPVASNLRAPEPAQSATMRQTQFFGQGSMAPQAPVATAANPSHANHAQDQYQARDQFRDQFRAPAQPAYSQPPQSNPNPPQFAEPSLAPNLAPNPGLVDDTLLGSRDRIANRWYALKGVFDPQAAPEQVPVQAPARVPVLAVFSLAGGVGKTCLVASLGRALSSRGERVLLVDTAAYGLLPFFFGARDQRPGQLRTFNPPGVTADAPIQLVTFDPDSRPQEASANPTANQAADPQAANQDWLPQEVARYARGSNRILVDLPTASGATTRRILRLSPVVLVPVLPDMNSVVSVGAIEGFFRNQASQQGGPPVMPYYVLNQFDYSLPLHLDVREILRDQIGDRLIPFALRRSASVSEALAEGMTVMDYAPNAVVAEDYANLAGWVRSVSAPAAQSYRGVRWSER